MGLLVDNCSLSISILSPQDEGSVYSRTMSPFQTVNFLSPYLNEKSEINISSSLVMMIVTYTSNKFLPKPNPVWKPDEKGPPFHKKMNLSANTTLTTVLRMLAHIGIDWLEGRDFS